MDIVLLAASDPRQTEVVALLMDDAHVGLTCFAVTGTEQPDDVLDVGRLVAELAEHEPKVHALVLASLRLEAPAELLPDHQRCDVDRWLELLDLFDAVGVDLLDWFIVVGDQAASMRSLMGMPSLWRGGP